jgi:hypothetical protein
MSRQELFGVLIVAGIAVATVALILGSIAVILWLSRRAVRRARDGATGKPRRFGGRVQLVLFVALGAAMVAAGLIWRAAIP